MKFYLVLIVFFIALFCNQHLRADLSNNFGSGVKNMGASGASFGGGEDVLWSYSLPASLSYQRKPAFSSQLILSHDSFVDISGVVVDSEKYGGSLTTNSRVDTDVPDTQNLFVGAVFPISEEKQSSFGLFISTPVAKLMSVETQSAFYPSYASYLSDNQRFTASLQYAWLAKSQWRYSIGMHLYFISGSSVVSRLPSSSSGSPRSSNMDLKVDVKPGVALAFSVLKDLNITNQVGLAFTQERDGRFNFDAETEVNVFGPSSIPISISGTSSLFYDPNQLDIFWKHSSLVANFYFGLKWSQWSKYKSSIVMMDISGANSFEQLNIDINYKDTFSPKLAMIVEGAKFNWGLGYSYVPTNIDSQSEASNLIDTDKQILSAFFESKWNEKLLNYFDWENSWSMGLQWQRLNNKTVYKTESDSVGYPKYNVGGNLYALAVQWNFKL